jgi:transketolase
MLLYSLLYLTGYEMTLDDIKNFRQWESRTPGHPEYCHAQGIETTTGPLGQGFATGVGMAIAEQYLAETFNRPDHSIIDHHIYAICSDGDMMEGVSSEAASIAGHLELNQLVYLYTDNQISIEGSTSLTFTEDVEMRFNAYGWFVQKVEGNDLVGVRDAIHAALAQNQKPSLIIARTHIGYGSPGKQDTAEAHGAPLGADEVKRTKENLGWPLKPEFYVPDEVLAHFRQAVSNGEKLQQQWQARFDQYASSYPEMAAEWKRMMEGRLPDGWDASLPIFTPADGKIATRTASGKALNAMAPKMLELIGGSADLAPSTDTYLKDQGDFKTQLRGRNLHFGVREHSMGAILSGISLSKMLLPFGGTFLIFSDYMRPPMRLAAMMEIPVVYVFTHDSIGLGEDGPTHEPVEQLPGLRAIPNMTLIRPADANETIEAWRIAVQHRTGPIAMVLTRQKLPVIDRTRYASAEGVRRGGYVLAGDVSEVPEVILLATGSEIHPTLEAYERLREKGIRARVVNMVCWEIFEKQSQDYRDEVLPPSVTARLAIEAASPLDWYKWVGLDGDVIGMTRFGASAPGEVNMKNFGFTPENIVEHAMALMVEPFVASNI